jgi:HK97 family phage major capsid protein
MNGFEFPPIGMPLSLMDETTFAKMYPNAPTAAFRAMQQGLRNRALLGVGKSSGPPLRRQVQAAKPATPKGSESVMSAATSTKPKPSAPVVATPSVPRLAYTAPRNLNASVRSISGADAYQRIYAAQVAIADLLSWERNSPDPAAAAYLSRNGLSPLNTAMTNPATGGGYLTPDPLAAIIIERMAAVGVAQRAATVQPMVGGVLTVPKETDGLQVYYTDEGDGFDESTAIFGTVGFSTRKRTVYGKVSNELMSDVGFSWTDRFARRSSYAFTSKQDDEFINGDGTSAYNGEVGLLASLGSAGIVSCATGHDTLAEVDAADVCNLMAKPHSDFLNGGEAFLCSPQVLALVLIRIFGASAISYDATGQLRFLGKPIYLSSKMPTSAAANTVFLLYGSFAEAAMIGDRGMIFAVSDQMPGLWEADVTALRATYRYDINVHEGGTTSVAGAYAGLKTAS